MRSQLILGPKFQLSQEASDLYEDEKMPTDRSFCGRNVHEKLSYLSSYVKRANKGTWVLELKQFSDNQEAVNRFDIAVQASERAKHLGAEIPFFTSKVIQQNKEKLRAASHRQ